MRLKRARSQPSQKGPAEYFTGAVRIDPLNVAPALALLLADSGRDAMSTSDPKPPFAVSYFVAENVRTGTQARLGRSER